MPVIGEHRALDVDHLLLAMDFSVYSEVAATYAAGIAKRFSSQVTLLHVVDLSLSQRYDGAILGISADEIRSQSSDNVDRALGDLAFAGIRASAHTVESHDIAASILSFSHQVKTDIIVMGTHGKQGLERVLLGSVAEAVIRHAACPVLTVGPRVTKLRGPLSFSSIIFATDLTPGVAGQAAIALSFAQEGQARLHLCHVLEPASEDISGTLDHQLRFEAALQKLVPSSAIDWCDPDCLVEHGEPSSRILAIASRVSSDLIILGAKSAAPLWTHLRSGVVGHVLSGAPCPVMTIASR